MKIFFVDCFDNIQLLDKLSLIACFDKRSLYPFTLTKSCLDLRVGILTLREKWLILTSMFGLEYADGDGCEEDIIWIPENVIPSEAFLHVILNMRVGEILLKDESIVAMRYNKQNKYRAENLTVPVHILRRVEDLFLLIGIEIVNDFKHLDMQSVVPPVTSTNRFLGNHFYIAEDVNIECATLNSIGGPIYIDEGVTIMEGANLRGPLYLGKGAVVKMGTAIYGNVSVGKQSVVGGEVTNSVIGDFSAKGHHGYLGCSVIGDWCNLGAGTSNSNLKNNLKTVSVYDYGLNDFRDTGLLKCGVFVGDYTRMGINSSLNTGTVIGIATMLADTSFYAKFVPSFTWVFEGNTQPYRFDKFMEYLEALYLSKGQILSEKIKRELNQLNKKHN